MGQVPECALNAICEVSGRFSQRAVPAQASVVGRRSLVVASRDVPAERSEGHEQSWQQRVAPPSRAAPADPASQGARIIAPATIGLLHSHQPVGRELGRGCRLRTTGGHEDR